MHSMLRLMDCDRCDAVDAAARQVGGGKDFLGFQ